MLLNDGGFGGVADNVKFPVEVFGSISDSGKCFTVHRDELVRVGFTDIEQYAEWVFWAGTEASTLADFKANRVRLALEYAVKVLQHEIDSGRMPKMLDGIGMGLFEDALK
jgi:hypothetical protein